MTNPTTPRDTLDDNTKKSKIDWSTPFDEWLIPLLNKYRYSGAIECRAIPSAIQAHLEAYITKQVKKARLDQTKHLQEAERKFGKVDWEAALYNLEDRPKYSARLEQLRKENI